MLFRSNGIAATVENQTVKVSLAKATLAKNTEGTVEASESGNAYATAANVAEVINGVKEDISAKGMAFVGNDNASVARALGSTLSIKGGMAAADVADNSKRRLLSPRHLLMPDRTVQIRGYAHRSVHSLSEKITGQSVRHGGETGRTSFPCEHRHTTTTDMQK